MTAGTPAASANLLTDAFVDKLREIVAAHDARGPGPVGPPRPGASPPAPPQKDRSDGAWGVVVLTPVGGIPKMWDSVYPRYTGTGTRYNDVEGTGTGTAVGEEGDRPGFAECEVYFLEHGTPGNPGRYLTRPRLVGTGWTIVVYNLSNVAVNGNQFVTPIRDGNGDWWVPSAGYLFQDCG